MSPRLEVADIFRDHGPSYTEKYGNRMPVRHHRTMRAIAICRTTQLGGHVDRCEHCGQERISYNSCRNRHCPKCQFLKAERWVEARKEDLLPIPYYHIVFTLPQELRSVALSNQRVVYNLLFKTASQTLLELSRDTKHLGARIGFTAVLHTWSQTLIHHPHVHCIVTGGGLADGAWKPARRGFFLPVKVISRLYRGKLLSKLKEADRAGQLRASVDPRILGRLYNKEWAVYCKKPFANAEHVISYLGRYTHRIAISNHRLISHNDSNVRFKYRDSRDGDRQKMMQLDTTEFIRRFLCHVLPSGFVKIRHYGILANRGRARTLDQCRDLLNYIYVAAKKPDDWKDLFKELTGVDLRACVACGGPLTHVKALAPQRAPPILTRGIA